MKTQTNASKLIAAMAFCAIFMFGGMIRAGTYEVPARNTVKILVLLDDQYGANLNIEDNQNCILENYAEYGWEVTLVSCSPTVEPCPWGAMRGCETITADMLTNELDNALDWDVITIAPGGTHEHLMACPYVLELLQDAAENNIPISAWCRGVRVLAAADVIDGVSITGHMDYEDEYLAAGAYYLGNGVAPVEDAGVITCVSATTYRLDMCELIRETVENATAIRQHLAKPRNDFQLDLYPNPICSSASIGFELEEADEVHIALYDRSGHMVLDVVKQRFDAGYNKVTFSPTSLPTGIYYLYVIRKDRKAMRKCMII